MEITVKGDPREIAVLVLAVQERPIGSSVATTLVLDSEKIAKHFTRYFAQESSCDTAQVENQCTACSLP